MFKIKKNSNVWLTLIKISILIIFLIILKGLFISIFKIRKNHYFH